MKICQAMIALQLRYSKQKGSGLPSQSSLPLQKLHRQDVKIKRKDLKGGLRVRLKLSQNLI